MCINETEEWNATAQVNLLPDALPVFWQFFEAVNCDSDTGPTTTRSGSLPCMWSLPSHSAFFRQPILTRRMHGVKLDGCISRNEPWQKGTAAGDWAVP